MTETNTKYIICRTCLTKAKTNFVSIKDMVKVKSEVVQIIKMIQSCCNVQIELTDELPQVVCKKCVIQVLKSYVFQQQSMKSDECLRKLNSIERSNYIDLKEYSSDSSCVSLTNGTIQVNESLSLNICPLEDDVKLEEKEIDVTHCGEEEIYLIENEKYDAITIQCQSEISDFNESSNEISNYVENLSTLDETKNDVCETIESDELKEEKRFKCSHCPKLLKSKRTLRQHSHLHRNYQHLCSECGEPFHTRKKFNMHLMMVHQVSPKHKCAECGKICPSNTYLTMHQLSHTGEKPFQCNICGTKVVSKPSLKSHMRLHTGETPFKCEYCDESFRTATQKSDHTRKHTGQKFQCNVCYKEFENKTNYISHRNIHRGKRHECEMCGKAFLRKSDLTSHIRVHTGEKPYICKTCGKAFNQSNSLTTHQWVHQKHLLNPKSRLKNTC